ncbi:MAG: PqqD family protein [Sphingomonas bacterium]|uniref:PqqD family protein n=1 Tax=Sphingomonas bacterium TaxID=1895847 RepID=UPI0026185F00|nr:PqqD family protein [Sphingomonas bacterium]MDB5711814.1 PqqD family protein [Sphingomonas bacterium]
MTMWQRTGEWIGSQVDDQYVMIHLDSGRYVALNHTASEAWETLETPHSRDQLIALFTARFDIEEKDCSRSVDALLQKMSELELIHLLAK